MAINDKKEVIDNWISFLSLSTLTEGIFKGNNGQLYDTVIILL